MLILLCWLLILVALTLLPGQSMIACQVERPAEAKAHWAYRIIDGKTCWYEGQPGLPKSRLQWQGTDWGPKPTIADEMEDEPPTADESREIDKPPTFDRRWEDAILDLKLWSLNSRPIDQWRPWR